MTKLLEQAFAEASKLPDAEQDGLARWVLDELRSDREWASIFAGSEDVLERLATEALEEKRAGRTTPLDPSRL